MIWMAEYVFEVIETSRCAFSISADSPEEAALLWQRARESDGFCEMLVERVRDSDDYEFSVPEFPCGQADGDEVSVTGEAREAVAPMTRCHCGA